MHLVVSLVSLICDSFSIFLCLLWHWHFFSLPLVSIFWGVTWTLCKNSHFSIVWPPILAFINDSCLKQFLHSVWQMVIFCFHHFFNIYYLEFYCNKELSLPHQLFIYLIFYHRVLWTLVLFMDYITITYHYLFCCLNCPKFGYLDCLHIGSYVLPTCPHHFLIIWHCKMFRFLLFSPCSSPGVSHFSKELWFLSIFLKIIFIEQNLGTWWGCCYEGVIAPRPSHQTELGNICIYTYVNIYLYPSIYMYIYTCIHLYFF